MEVLPKTDEPYPFTQADLNPDVLERGIGHALAAFETWRDANPDRIAQHIDSLTDSIDTVARSYDLAPRLGRLALPSRRRSFDEQNETLFVQYFGLHNLGEELSPDGTAFLRERLHAAREIVDSRRTHIQARGDFMHATFDVMRQLAPELQGTTQMDWLEARVGHLHRILPEAVIREGGMGKVLRTIMGVVAVCVYDVADEPLDVRRSHMKHIIPGAYALGSTYALVDDALQSKSGDSIDPKDKDMYHSVILDGLTTGEDIDPLRLPDHPVAEELLAVYSSLRKNYPFEEYRHLYYAIESMYRAQRRDSKLTPEDAAANGGIRGMYPDMAIKASMTRVVANILGRRDVADENYTKFLNAVFGSQIKDDFEDHVPDALEGNSTIFTTPYDSDSGQPNPLYDLFAFDAYVAQKIWEGHPGAVDALIRFGASEFGPYLANNKSHGENVLHTYPHTAEIKRFITHATSMPVKRARKVLPRDMFLEGTIGQALQVRDQADIDPRVFVTDRLQYMNHVIAEAIADDTVLAEVAMYSVENGGKRLRPALTLMLAEALGIPYDHIKPLLQTAELFHTGSLIFDDLPAQDNATTRRGKTVPHIVYPEWAAQLAGLSMISRGFGSLPALGEHFSLDRVSRVIAYADEAFGFEGLCRGQAMDLGMESGQTISDESIMEMYHLKTSVAIEAALVPLMMLAGRSQEEINHIKQYAHHAGIIFQIKDDILDVTASAEQMGKSTQLDEDKVNVVRRYGLETAQAMMEEHLQAAIACCIELSFNTNLLQNVAAHFASRNR